MVKMYFPREDTFRRYEINSILFHSVLFQVHNLPLGQVLHKISARANCILQRQKILFMHREYSIDKGWTVTDVESAA